MRKTSEIDREDRLRVLERDGWRCLRCGRRPATFQHRRGKGAGGLQVKSPKVTCADGVALCLTCNIHAEGSLQATALRHGWKIRRRCPTPASAIPYFDQMTGNWWLPNERGDREWVTTEWAEARIAETLDD